MTEPFLRTAFGKKKQKLKTSASASTAGPAPAPVPPPPSRVLGVSSRFGLGTKSLARAMRDLLKNDALEIRHRDDAELVQPYLIPKVGRKKQLIEKDSGSTNSVDRGGFPVEPSRALAAAI